MKNKPVLSPCIVKFILVFYIFCSILVEVCDIFKGTKLSQLLAQVDFLKIMIIFFIQVFSYFSHIAGASNCSNMYLGIILKSIWL